MNVNIDVNPQPSPAPAPQPQPAPAPEPVPSPAPEPTTEAQEPARQEIYTKPLQQSTQTTMTAQQPQRHSPTSDYIIATLVILVVVIGVVIWRRVRRTQG